MRLPDLPPVTINKGLSIWSAQQMREYGRQCAEAMREACLKAAEGHYGDEYRLAHEIRALEIEI